MDRPRLIRWLRVAVSAVSLVVCVMLIGLWVRSYHRIDIYHWLGHGAMSDHGKLLIDESWVPSKDQSWTPEVNAVENSFLYSGPHNYEPAGTGITIPHWFLVLLSAAPAAVPWLPWWSTRFSLRTMLIVTAVVALTLGIFVWLTR